MCSGSQLIARASRILTIVTPRLMMIPPPMLLKKGMAAWDCIRLLSSSFCGDGGGGDASLFPHPLSSSSCSSSFSSSFSFLGFLCLLRMGALSALSSSPVIGLLCSSQEDPPNWGLSGGRTMSSVSDSILYVGPSKNDFSKCFQEVFGSIQRS